MFFVNLPIYYAYENPAYLEYFLGNNPVTSQTPVTIGPELGIDCNTLDVVDTAWHHELADTFRAAGIPCSVHLPFINLRLGSPDRLIREASQTRLAQAFEVAKIYEPKHMVAHAEFNYLINGTDKEAWLCRSTHHWNILLDSWKDHPPLHLENTLEPEPQPIAELVQAFDRPNVSLCLDVGHWHSFSQGHARQNLHTWLDHLGPHIKHLHLHDNDGRGDQHLGMGAGTIPWDTLFQELKTRGIQSGVTLEPHEEKAFMDTMDFFARHPQYLDQLTLPAPKP